MEDYKRKYEQAMLRMNKWVEGSEITDPKEVAEYVFPELKESEDEKIRKECISIIDAWDKSCRLQGDYCEVAPKCIAWLEKQDPKKHEEELEKAYKCADEVQYRKGYEDAKKEIEKQDEQKPTNKVEPKFKVGDVVRNISNGDTVTITQIDKENQFYNYSGWDGMATVHSDFSISEQNNWELVEQKPAWSEEDEQHLKEVIFNMHWAIKNCMDKEYAEKEIEKHIDWLKSLKERMKGE